MEFLKNMRVRTALLTVIAPILVMVLTGASYATWQMTEIDARNSELIERGVKVLQDLTNTRAYITQISNLLYREAIERDRDAIAQIDAQLDRVQSDYRNLVEESLKLEPSLKSKLSLAQASFEALWPKINAARLAAQIGQIERTHDLLRGLTMEISEVRAEHDKIAKEWNAEIIRRSDFITSQVQDVVRNCWIAVFISILTSILFAIMIGYNSIISSLHGLRDHVVGLSEGDTKSQNPFASLTNEVGEIGRAMVILTEVYRSMEAQRWVKTGLSEISLHIQATQSIQDLASEFLTRIALKLEIGRGAFFVVDDNRVAHLIGTYAHRDRKSFKSSFAEGEGLVGQCLLERKPITITCPPIDYLEINSGLGRAAPNAIMVLPVMHLEKVSGVVELALFNPLSQNEQALLDELLPTLSMTIEIITRTEKAQQLLAETQVQAATLAASERQLSSRTEELEVINDQMAQQGRLVEEQAEELGRERTMLRSLIDNIPNLIFVKDTVGTYITSNQAFADLLGLRVDQIIGKTDFDVFPKQLAEFFRERDAAMMAEGLKKVNEEEVDYPDGRHAHLETTKVPLRSQSGAILGLIGVSHDITDRKLAEARLAATEERSRLILESVQDGVVGMDRDGRITFANPAAPAMLGYTTEELIGAQMHPLIHHSYPDGKPFPREDCSMYLTAIDGRARVVENEVLWRKDGRPLPVEYSTTPIQKDGELIGTVVVYRDITHR